MYADLEFSSFMENKYKSSSFITLPLDFLNLNLI